MKRINYIFVLLVGIFFLSCEKENLSEQKIEKEDNDLNINQEDTAGIVVPEGYSMVIMAGNKVDTKAVGSSDRIRHLQYLVYENTGNGYQLYKKVKVYEGTGTISWPYAAQVEILPKGKEWIVVFLGNVNKNIFPPAQTADVLTGVDEGINYYGDARIILPQVEFTDKTLFHKAEGHFDTNSPTVEVPVTLKRIVSRHDIYQEGPAALDLFYTQILKDKLYNDIFTGSESVFRYQLKDVFLKEVIWPVTFMGLQAVTNPGDYSESYKAVKWYLDNPGLYGQTYLNAWKSIVDETRRTYGFLKQDDYPNNYYLNLAEYLYGIFVDNQDSTALKGMLSQICAEDNDGFIAKVQSKIGTFFKANYKSGVLNPWNGNAIMDRTGVPSVIDFSFTVMERDVAGLKFYTGATRTNGRKYFSVVTLPDNEESNKLTYNKIYLTTYSNNGGGINQLPDNTGKTEISGNVLDGGAYQQNMKYDCIQKVGSASLIDKTQWTPYANNWQEIGLSYYNILKNLSLKDDGKGTMTIGSENYSKVLCSNQNYNGIYYVKADVELQKTLAKVLSSIHNLPIDDEMGTTIALRIPFNFKAPVFQDNMNILIVWDEAKYNPEP